MNQPINKQIKPIHFLYHRAEVKISDLINQIPVSKELMGISKNSTPPSLLEKGKGLRL